MLAFSSQGGFGQGGSSMQGSGADFLLVFGRALGKVLVSIHGPLDATTAPQLKDRLVDLIDGQGNRHVVLDLGGMTSIDPSGLSVLVDARKRIQKHAGEIVLSGPPALIMSALASSGLDKVFSITPTWAHPAHGYDRTTERPDGRRRSG